MGAAFTAGGVRPVFQKGARVTVTANPAGARVTVDGTSWATPVTFEWAPGSQHRLAAANQSAGRVQTRFVGWAHGGDASQTVTVPAEGAAEFTANFKVFYRLTTGATGSGSIGVNPNVADRYHEAGASVQVTATPTGTGVFRNWGGAAAGVQGATATITMDDEKYVTANFAALAAPRITQLSPTTLPQGSSAFLLRVAGSGLLEGLTQVRVNNMVRNNVRFYSQGQIEVPMTARDVAAAGNLTVTVSTPGIADVAQNTAVLAVAAAPAGGCTLVVGTLTSTATTLDAGGGSVVAPIQVPAGCPWTASSSEEWLEVVPPPAAGGNGFLNLYAKANPGASTRTARVTINGSGPGIVVTQTGLACNAVLSANELRVPSGGGSGSVSVGLYSKECAWNRAVPVGSEWLQTVATADTGGGMLTVTAEANATGAERVGRVVVGGATLTVRQAGDSTPPVISAITSEASTEVTMLAPGARFAITGKDLARGKVFFGDVEAIVFDATPERLVGRVPADAALGMPVVTVKVDGLTSEPVAVMVMEAAPAIYAESFQNEDGESNTEEAAAAAGSTVSFLLTGEGGSSSVAVTIGGTAAETFSVEAGELGKVRITVKVPEDAPSGAAQVVATVAGQASNAAVLRVK